MTVWATAYAALILLVTFGIHYHKTQIWSGNHWVVFGTPFERFLFSVGGYAEWIVVAPFAVFLGLSLWRKAWFGAVLIGLLGLISFWSAAFALLEALD